MEYVTLRNGVQMPILGYGRLIRLTTKQPKDAHWTR